jgi:hypothetical protein
MKIAKKVASLLDALQNDRAPTKEECVLLLQLPETSLEAALMRTVADSFRRRRFSNEGIILPRDTEKDTTGIAAVTSRTAS